MTNLVRKTETFVQLSRDLLLSRIFRIVDKNADYKPGLEDDLVFDPKLKKFVPVKIRRRKSETIAYSYESGGRKYAFRFSCFEILNETDARVLCAVGALASAKSGKAIEMDEAAEETKEMLGKLKQEGINFRPEKNRLPYRVETSHTEIVKSLGMKVAGPNIEMVRRSLDRLSKVHVKVEVFDPGNETLSDVSFNLLSYAQMTNVKSGQNTLAVVFNAITAQALLGSSPGSIYIQTAELEKLAPEKAGTQLLHFRLCAQINPGSSQNFSGETLCGYLWKDSDFSTIDRFAKSRRLYLLGEAVSDLSAIGWTSEKIDLKNGKGWKISRPPAV